MLNPVHLQTLRAVLAAGSLSGAAKELGYTTSAVSQQITALERTLGMPLFERGPRNLWPTSAAVQMGVYAAEILSRLREVEDEVRGFLDGTRGRLRIGAFSTVGARLLPGALARLVTRYPNAELTVQEDSNPGFTVDSVHEARTDLGFVYKYDVVPQSWPTGLQASLILDEELVIIGGPLHKMGPRLRIDLRELSTEIWVSNRSDSPGHENLIRLCAQLGFSPNVRFQSNDFDVIRGIVRENLGVALVPALALGIDRSITMLRLASHCPRRKVFALHRVTDPNPLLPIAVESIRQAARDFERWTTEAFGVRVDSPLASAVGPGGA